MPNRTKLHIWFLPSQKPTLKNQKSNFSPTLTQVQEEKLSLQIEQTKHSLQWHYFKIQS